MTPCLTLADHPSRFGCVWVQANPPSVASILTVGEDHHLGNSCSHTCRWALKKKGKLSLEYRSFKSSLNRQYEIRSILYRISIMNSFQKCSLMETNLEKFQHIWAFLLLSLAMKEAVIYLVIQSKDCGNWTWVDVVVSTCCLWTQKQICRRTNKLRPFLVPK